MDYSIYVFKDLFITLIDENELKYFLHLQLFFCELKTTFPS